MLTRLLWNWHILNYFQLQNSNILFPVPFIRQSQKSKLGKNSGKRSKDWGIMSIYAGPTYPQYQKPVYVRISQIVSRNNNFSNIFSGSLQKDHNSLEYTLKYEGVKRLSYFETLLEKGIVDYCSCKLLFNSLLVK